MFKLLRFLVHQLLRFLGWIFRGLFNGVKAIFKVLIQVIIYFIKTVKKLIQKIIKIVKTIIKLAKERPTFLLSLILFLIFTGIAISALIPSSHRFEASLLTEELSFETRKPDQLLLNSIYEIRTLGVRGKQTLTLTGMFQSDSIPQLKTPTQRTLTIELPNEQSFWQVTPVDSENASEIEIIELRLIEQNQVKNLQYNAANQDRLAFSLNPIQDNSSTNQSNQLELYWGSQTLNIVLENYRIPDLNFPAQGSEAQPLQDLKFTPEVSEQQIEFPGIVDLSVNLPNPKTVDSSGWFWSGIPVENVQLSTLERTGSEVRDEIYRSTLLKGKVYMAEQTQEIQPNQFLLIESPGIQRINHLSIQPQGIEIRVSGETRKIEVGLDPNFPISSIQSNWWTRHFSKEEAVAIISFSTALMSSLLLWLVNNIFKGSSTD